MKKTFSVCLLATSLLAVTQLATADDLNPASRCPALSDIQTQLQPVSKTVSLAPGLNRFNISAYYYPPSPPYKYYGVKIFSVKGQTEGEALTNALAMLNGSKDAAPRIESNEYNFSCVYSLDSSNVQNKDEYNDGIYPTLVVQLDKADTTDFYAIPKNLNISK